MRNVLFFLAIIMLSAYIINSLRGIYSLWNKHELITQAKFGLQQTQEENSRLKKDLRAASDPLFVEKNARNKLFLTKPGEYTVYLAQNSNSTHQLEKRIALPYWRQWLGLFVY